VFKSVHERVWAFDVEWVPDPLAGRLLYEPPASASDADVLRRMWEEGGADGEDPTPFLKTVLCRIVSIAAVERRRRPDGNVTLNLMSLPRDPANAEEAGEPSIVGTFLEALGEYRPQLVGFNSIDSDLKILVQRGLIRGVTAAGFCSRPERPWEGVDYFARGSEWNIDLKQILGGWGKAVPSLHELAVQCGIPGKLDVDGNRVAQLWLAGDLARIVAYNEFDALTTYLLWLRLARFAGHFDSPEYAEEEERVRSLLEGEVKSEARPHLSLYLEEWSRLRRLVGERAG
jgi:predicted PolB exonuclease-like 3'-5' exonuclease